MRLATCKNCRKADEKEKKGTIGFPHNISQGPSNHNSDYSLGNATGSGGGLISICEFEALPRLRRHILLISNCSVQYKQIPSIQTFNIFWIANCRNRL